MEQKQVQVCIQVYILSFMLIKNNYEKGFKSINPLELD